MAKKWKCTVCGYLHEGAQPPLTCPVCGADRSRFIPLEEERINLLRDLVDTFVLHPVAAHFPNGLVPTAVLFLLVTLATGSPYTERTVHYLLGVVLAVIPVSMASGIYDWQVRFKGEKAMIFYKKIGLASLLLILGLTAVALRYARPVLVSDGGTLRWLYAGLLLAMLPVITLLGHYGAKLAYQWRKKDL